jgi:methionyl-tRNA formyltransferase
MSTNVILFGSASFSIPIAEALQRLDGVQLAAIVAQPDKPGKRGVLTAPDTKAWAETHEVLVLQPGKLDAAFTEALAGLSPTVGVIASYGKIIPQRVLDVFPRGVINVHGSLLPRHRGASPIQTAILEGDTEAGITLMLTDAELDHGPVIAQQRIALTGTETSRELHATLAHLGAEMITDALPKWLAGDIASKEQQHDDATFTKLFTREDARIDWALPTAAIERKIRAFDDWPGTFTILPDGKRLKIFAASIVTDAPEAPGIVRRSSTGQLEVAGTDGWLTLLRVQPEGGKPMDGNAFLNGQQNLPGKRLR